MKKGIKAFKKQAIQVKTSAIKGDRKRPGRAKFGNVTLE